MTNSSSEVKSEKTAVFALILGVAAIVLLGLAVLLGILVEAIGIAGFLSFVMIFALAAVVLALISLRKSDNRRVAMWGLVLGCIALFLSLFARVAIFIYFIPWLGA